MVRSRSFALVLVALLASIALWRPARADDTPRIAVVSAFAPEWTLLLGALENRKDETIAGTTFATGRLEGKEVVLFLSGVSMVNAAMTTERALDRFKITAIVFSGIAGGVDPGLSIGDVVVPDTWGQYLELVMARQVGDGWKVPPFFGTPFPNYGMMFPQPVEIARAGAAKPEKLFWIAADAKLVALAREIAATVKLDACAKGGACLSAPPKLAVGGKGVSGSAFVDNAAFRAWVFDTFKAEVLDMESAAVAHVASSHGVPFVVFRSLSDLAGGGPGENEIGTFFQLASDNSARVVKAFVAAMP
ncbi:5'-methylthioadenosine/S-adenosylhomocysteine nucleosidase [Methyloraptor flagellatus]|uniref:5'-methylthioadenosine/S-adenosylhomocysteine nucleosidase n=1 Tax=Methyloraptor flagellatus TaxID=3162530 RepID=A0AAU7XDV8_9HYPH